jgi:DNA-binding LytR/AlgR family response regulator
MMPTALIADDEDLQRTDLRRLLAQAWPELVIVAECEDGGEALAAIAEHRPDIAFLDIRMPALTGLDVARASEGRCRVVFTTAYDAHAIEAFGLGAVDYLLKPIAVHRLQQTIERLRSQLAAGAAMPPSAHQRAGRTDTLDQHQHRQHHQDFPDRGSAVF